MMLNPQLNIQALRHVFSTNGAISIQNFFLPEVAEAIRAAITRLNWELEIKDYSQTKSFRMPVSDGMDSWNLLETIAKADFPLDRDRLFFVRYCADEEKFNSDQLREFSDFLHSQQFLDMMIDITGNRHLDRVWVEATCYDKCCFLGGHRDDHHLDNAIAFVMNFTRRWQLDWGGLLMLQRPNSHPLIVSPAWNTLSMFNVPIDHLVSCVSPAANEKRYSMTGWLRRGAESGQN